MKIEAVSFRSKIVEFPSKIVQFNLKQNNKPNSQEEGDIFVKTPKSADVQQLDIKTLDDYNTELNNILNNLRLKKVSPDDSADKFIGILKDKQLEGCFDYEVAKVGTVPNEDVNVSAIETFYDLTFNIQSRLDKSLNPCGKTALIASLLDPFDSRYEDFCIKCDDAFGDEDDAGQVFLTLNSLIDTDNEDISDDEKGDVIANITECLKDLFSKDSEPEFNINVKIGEDYDEEKVINAFKKLFALVTKVREDAQDSDKE